ncbi:HlyD family secretion protein [Sphingomonas qomolangmaensis]|uniref:HlyD family efflux transporter periplasmic adaptor subunit n=1 Tax=Sphingomonas qomolangmaensis TaxID=2918765 RepID=A0ABY5LCY8_9SPHN|nr:HlyD family efflux transporter periplasmic adaptor subunit [Sphingomonas qomolangmaensis]UUL82576.1 HlyD family efflux transporter periplasmic adaptor subunit [Sphingomonas qomolangmaensis]
MQNRDDRQTTGYSGPEDPLNGLSGVAGGRAAPTSLFDDGQVKASDPLDGIAESREGARRSPSTSDVSNDQPDTLLRREAIQHARETAFGQPIARFPVSWTWATLTTLLVIIVVAAIMFNQTFERTAIVPGSLDVDGGRAQLFVNQPGTVESVLVGEGEIVKKGQPLFTLANNSVAIDGRGLRENLEAGFDEQAAILNERKLSLRQLAIQRDSEALAAQRLIESEMLSLRGAFSHQNQRLKMAEEDLDVIKPVAERGFISGNAVRQRELVLLAARQAADETAGRLRVLQEQGARQRAVSAQAKYTTQQEATVLAEATSALNQRRIQSDVGARQQIVAPTTGRVSAVQISPGQIARPQFPLLAIIPKGRAIVAVLHIPSRSIGLIRVGQEVRMRYHAFPYQRFGAAKAVIRQVSQTLIRPEESPSGALSDEPAYRVIAIIDRNDITAYGTRHRLLPGMTFDADIILEKRSFADWILEPLRARGNHG